MGAVVIGFNRWSQSKACLVLKYDMQRDEEMGKNWLELL